MKVKQLGNGGGFDFHMANSSFLIESNNHTILFDCGFNIMDRLKSDSNIKIEDINDVYISHMDEDHVGNLKMFIYWRYFIHKKRTNVICHRGLEIDIINYLKNMESEFIGCRTVDAYMFDILTIGSESDSVIYPDFNIKATDCFHGKLITHGAIFYVKNKSVFISADTKASSYIEKVSKDCDLIFHDFSNWDFVTRNVHTCKTDFELEYTSKYKSKVIKYHTGEENFKKSWYIL